MLHAAPGWSGAVAGTVLLVGGIACTALVAPLRLRALAAASVAVPGAAAVTAAVVVLVGLLAVGAVLLP